MISFEEAGRILDEAAESLPREVFRELNGGVNLLPDKRRDADGMYILGMYFHNSMGRYVEIYYGSFAEVFRGRDDDIIRAELGKTLRHELTHHLEDMAGDRSLIKWDEQRRAQLLSEMRASPPDSPLFAGGYAGPGADSPLRRRSRPASDRKRLR